MCLSSPSAPSDSRFYSAVLLFTSSTDTLKACSRHTVHALSDSSVLFFIRSELVILLHRLRRVFSLFVVLPLLVLSLLLRCHLFASLLRLLLSAGFTLQ
ncbi:hypothetical protein PIB30_034300 [Stylosanthes scabra]|uniref:Uncharacterized protein n=1 Tax=Stylosanthes scabra TaxID=79078 RepID=A0ABU6QCW9_9FABA|nr:hypothetical protein [Stylosanthes scabra]